MMELLRIEAPLTPETARALRAGQRVLLSGVVYTARDAAHRRLCELLDEGGEPPVPLAGAVIYYCGPAPAPPGRPIGSAGPTSSYRMDPYVPRLLEAGMLGMIGKGPRSEAVRAALMARGGVYFAATGGAGALLARCVESAELVAYPERAGGPAAARGAGTAPRRRARFRGRGPLCRRPGGLFGGFGRKIM